MGRFCSRCKVEQPLERQKNSYCNPCKQERKKEARIESRKTRGIPPAGFFKEHCSDCHKPLEDVRQSYCNACRSVRNKAWALESGRVKKNQTGLCPCGAERAPNQPYFCATCKAEDSRKWRAAHRTPQEVREKAKQERDAVQKVKHAVRNLTRYYITTGALIKQPCEVCGTDQKVEAHHDDYNKPMEVRWLCRKHHLEHHRLKD